MARVVVLGATGFIGSHIAEQLARAGHTVHCPVRASSRTDFLRTLGVSITPVDFASDTALAEALTGAEAVCNAIADTRLHISDAERRRTDVTLTARLYRAARRAGVRRFLQLSTVMVYGFDRPPRPVDEAFVDVHRVKHRYGYCRVAAEREAVLLNLADETSAADAPTLALLRPANTIGRRDTSFLPNFLNSHRRGVFPVVSGGHWRLSLVDTRDIGRAMAHLLTVDATAPEAWLVKGYDTDWRAFKAALDRTLDRPSRLMNLPKAPMKAAGWLMERLYPYGSEPPLTRFSVDVLSTSTLFDDAKIRRSGFAPRYTLEETLAEALS